MVTTNTVVVNNYQTKQFLGNGSFGSVYIGEYILKMNEAYNMPSTVAIKIIDKEKLKKKCINEINILLELNSKNNQHIVKLYDIAQNKNTIYLLMEYCPCKDLSFYMKSHFYKNHNNAISKVNNNDPLIGPWGGFNEYIVIYFLFQLTSALKCMHDMNIFHRDLKPQNILLSYDPERRLHALPRDTFSNPTSCCLVHLPFLKVADFGFAKILPPEDLTQTMIGSPLYMASEILKGQKYSNLSDLWSVGVILYQLATFKLPYVAETITKLKEIVTSDRVDFYFPGEKQFKNEDEPSYDPDAFCPETKELIRNLLTKNPNKRISYEKFFEIVNGHLKFKWDYYRNIFNIINKNEKEEELGLNDEINFEYEETHSSQFTPIPPNLTSQFIELTSKSQLSTITNEKSF